MMSRDFGFGYCLQVKQREASGGMVESSWQKLKKPSIVEWLAIFIKIRTGQIRLVAL